MARWPFAVFIALLVGAAGCDGSAPTVDAGPDAAPHVTWSCPEGWVESAVGGCGPSAVLCVSDGGAAPGACSGIDPYAPRTVTDPDGGAPGTPVYRTHDGRFAGGWHEPDDAAPYPPSDWTPDAGDGSTGDAWAPSVAFDSCPPGWTSTSEGACDPHLATSCDAASGPLPGDTCTATSAASCAPGPYPDPGPAAIGSVIVHARAGADAPSADGSEAHPFPTVSAAIAAAGNGGYVLVAAGRYTESITVEADVHVLGTCSANVVSSAPAGANAVTVSNGARATFAGLSIDGPGRGLAITSGATVTLDRVAFGNVADIAIAVDGAGSTLHASDVWIHDLVASAGASAVALTLGTGAAADATRLSIQRAQQNAIVGADGAGALALHDVAILSTRAGDAMHQASVFVSGGALDLQRAVVDDNIAKGLSAVGTSATVRDVLISRTVAATANAAGFFAQQSHLDIERLHVDGVRGGNGLSTLATDVDVRRSLFEDLHAFPRNPASGIGVALVSGERHLANVHVQGAQEYGALFYSDPGSPGVSITDSIIEGVTLPWADAGGGGLIGFAVHAMQVSRVLVRDVPIFGIGADHDCDADVRDSVVREVHGTTSSPTASGLFVYEGARLAATNVGVYDVEGIGAIAQTPQSTLTMTHSIVAHVHPAIVGAVAVGGGVLVAEAAHGTIRGVRLEDIPVFGFGTYQQKEIGTEAEMVDSTIVHVWAPMITARPFAAASAALAGTTATLRNTLVVDASPIGAIATDGSTLYVRDSAFRDTRTSSGGTASAAILGTSGGSVEASRTLIERSQNTAIIAISGGQVAFRDGIVSETVTDQYGFGTGVNASGNGQVLLERVSLLDTRGASLMATPYEDPLNPRTVGASITGRDLYVARVARSTIRIEYDEAATPQRSTQEVAYGAHAGAMCTVDLERAVLRDAGYGFYDSSGSFTLRDGVIASMREGGGAQSGSTPVLTRVGFVANASDAIVQRNDLPEGAMLPAPQPACSTPGCL